ncbi:uncharacterized protein L969DRAFT_193346 [Mixia osmundae IAM 14324]|uniref:SWIM-type domain-containing protein n=1 Tax=Mixia osmundae (strain CBS 9802 / IAM 14324 / JCM 22182 / KY 12970) TaxID=764103 RepID=G7DWD8_MIXOS|nr:uncharacterized protein L969DRAFT_193346 [Mixia osmundae IAM 14324]KEI37290.1 hypothetical protein L969DRAFT_193346 [Mixia osmundae IAM 14324]GAA94898.1 hypothetical protein E5Q_01553 [Mixia osmundae IAM 14324]
MGSTTALSALDDAFAAVVAQLGSDHKGRLTEANVRQLALLCGSDNVLMGALELVDHGDVCKASLENSERSAYVVAGSSSSYTITPGLTDSGEKSSLRPFCPCPAFAQVCLLQASHPFCKHVLAAMIAIRLGKVQQRTVSLDILAKACSM